VVVDAVVETENGYNGFSSGGHNYMFILSGIFHERS
jgi:hypothetical protein